MMDIIICCSPDFWRTAWINSDIKIRVQEHSAEFLYNITCTKLG